jgi:acyl-coenzyme A thioesterase PaaI-like protein
MPEAPGMQGAFTASMGELISYRYVGCQAEAHDQDHATSHTTVRSHLCTPGSLSSAALAISMLDAAGINVDPIHILGLTEVDIHLYEPATGIERFRTVGRVIRRARSQVFTECRFEDAATGRVIGAGAGNWSVIVDTPEGFVYTDPGPGYPEGGDTPPVLDAFQLEPRDVGGFVLPALSPRVGAEVLHHGPMLVGTEQAALQAGAAAAGTDRLALRASSMRIVRPGREAPFTFTSEALTATDDAVGCRSEIVDGNGATTAVALFTYAR